ncbi:MAG: hypothetical protein ACREVE_04770 [Gammaproteobacteria bacterium]
MWIRLVTGAALASVSGLTAAATLSQSPPGRAPDASIDLATAAGVAQVKGRWRYSDTRIVEVDFRQPDADGQPTGAPVKTYDFSPHAGAAEFDDSGWEVVSPATVTQRRSTGKLCFNWYRINVTIPTRIGDFDPTGATVAFDTALDDYAEVWVDGEIARAGSKRRFGDCRLERAQSPYHWPRRAARTRDSAGGVRHERPDLQSAYKFYLDAPRAAGFLPRQRRIGTRRGDAAGGQCRGAAPRFGAGHDRSREPQAVQARRGLQVHRRSRMG